jgi:hypothetical protein
MTITEPFRELEETTAAGVTRGTCDRISVIYKALRESPRLNRVLLAAVLKLSADVELAFLLLSRALRTRDQTWCPVARD